MEIQSEHKWHLQYNDTVSSEKKRKAAIWKAAVATACEFISSHLIITIRLHRFKISQTVQYVVTTHSTHDRGKDNYTTNYLWDCKNSYIGIHWGLDEFKQNFSRPKPIHNTSIGLLYDKNSLICKYNEGI